jgi:hypothetical protein
MDKNKEEKKKLEILKTIISASLVLTRGTADYSFL